MSNEQLNSTASQHPVIVKYLHWAYAGLFSVSVITGLVMTSLSSKEYLSYLLPKYHYLFGVILILISSVRVFNRIRLPRPAYSAELSKFEFHFAKTIQWLMLLAGLMLMFSGYILATADGNPAILPWGTWLPQVLPDDVFSLEQGLLLHNSFLIIFCVCLCLHVAGFIKHQVSDKTFYKRIL